MITTFASFYWKTISKDLYMKRVFARKQIHLTFQMAKKNSKTGDLLQ